MGRQIGADVRGGRKVKYSNYWLLSRQRQRWKADLRWYGWASWQKNFSEDWVNTKWKRSLPC